jgi:putative NADH-flavin reductase
MKIVLIGSTGTIGQRLLQEALARGHEVTAMAHDPAHPIPSHQNLTITYGDIFDPESIMKAVAGHDVVISAYGPPAGRREQLLAATRCLLEAVKRAPGVKRLITVGGTGTLEIAPGVQLLDTVLLPKACLSTELAHRDAAKIIHDDVAGLDWTILSPALNVAPGIRTGLYRTGTESLIVDENGMSRISTEDYAAALLDEVENYRFSRRQFTVGY